VEVLKLKNTSLLRKWLYKLMNEEGMWQELLHNKYLKTKNLSQISANTTDPTFWKGLIHIKYEFFSRSFTVVGDGKSNKF
jgi:hypothetical protein